MENTEGKVPMACGTSDKDCVRVAVNIRPLITTELMIGCSDCITVVPGEPQVQIGSHAFTFDYVFGNGGIPCPKIFDECVAPLVDALIHGYNGTVLAYGQTGSGKTYTMGTNYDGHESNGGIIPKVMEAIYSKVHSSKDQTEYLIRVSFIEIFKEEVFDLLDSHPHAVAKGEGTFAAKSTGPARVPVQIRETAQGGITLTGVTEVEVKTKEEMASYLSQGSHARATGSTNMNSQSSRSHAIFTISMEQKRISRNSNDDPDDDILSAKLHLVDLAGSERAKRTGADGLRLKEGIHINKGLLALGNVISALGDEKKRKEGGHVPYRDSKLTRLLQDSLGGNSKTVMIACVSPADSNTEETLNTLKYANRARNIQNRAVINRDPVAAQMQRMRSQIEQLQTELLFYRGDSSFDELQILKHKVSLLEASNSELQQELQKRRIACDRLSQRAVEAQVEKDQLAIKLEAARSGKSWDEIAAGGDMDFDLVKGYVSKIQELEEKLLRMQRSNLTRKASSECPDIEGDSRDADIETIHDLTSITGVEEDEKEQEHSSLQEKLDRELKELDKRLEQKEAEMKMYSNGDTSVLKQHYEKKVMELEHEKKTLQKEIEQLRHNLNNISSNGDDSAKKLKDEYLQKLNTLEAQVAELKKKQDAQAQLLRQKQKSDEAARRLQEEIHRIKSQKVQLQNKIKQESEQFRLWKASREKEVLQLKKEGRRNEYEMHKLLALNQRQKMVLQRKTEEAAMASKRLKELLESRKTGSRDVSAFGTGKAPGLQALINAIEHELEVTVRVHEVRSEYERQMEERAKMAREVAGLKGEAAMLRQSNLSECPEGMSPGARNSRIIALENMLSTSSSALVSMASHLSEAEERERLFSGRGRWNQLRSLGDAKSILNYLFNLASSSRCSLWDKEVDIREKDAEIKELKEKVVKLNCFVRQLEKQKSEVVLQMQQIQQSTVNNLGMRYGGHAYDLRQGPRMSGFNFGRSLDLTEDMDTLESEHSNSGDEADDDEWILDMSKKRNSKNKGRQSSYGSSNRTTERDDSGSLKVTEGSGDLSTRSEEVTRKPTTGICCTCSKNSTCKTAKCECRANGGNCSASCGCSSNKCSNRDEAREHVSSKSKQTDENCALASEGAALLQNALTDMPREQQNDDIGPLATRKPLSDIGNTAGKSIAPRPNQRKKWRKSVVQLVPAAVPPTPTENQEPPTIKTETIETPRVQEVDTQLRLPRAMRSTSTSNSNNPLRDRNTTDHQEESSLPGTGKGSGIPAPPHLRQPKAEEKENNGV